MKKNIVLFILFVLPIVAYLFFASGINSFTRLPMLTPRIAEFGDWKPLNGQPVHLKGKITVLGFGGYDLIKNRGNLFNLNQKVYERYHEFKDLQFVYICPIGTEKDAQILYDKFTEVIDMTQWRFVFASPQQIQEFYKSMKLKGKLNSDLGTRNVYLIDKERNLRGRKDKKEYLEGYDTFHPSAISNEMLDDFKVLLYEYKAALKKNHNATKNEVD
jgi:hypothetical protein